MRIGVLTGGGDVPGLNVVIKCIAEGAAERGWNVVGIHRGWLGLLSLDPDDRTTWRRWTSELNRGAVRTIGREGGTVLHTSRIEPQFLPIALAPERLRSHYGENKHIDATPHVLKAVQALELDAIVAIGGDGTLRFAARLAQEGVAIISIPKTMDNDVHGTDYAIGFSTAITRSVDAISALRTSAGSHERILIVELFGRRSGQTALYAGLLANADRTFIAECPFDPARAAQLLEADRVASTSRYAIAVISEGAHAQGGTLHEGAVVDAYGRGRLGGVGEVLASACRQASAEDVIVQNLGYLMRSGPPDATDRQIALAFGSLAVELLAAGRSGVMCAVQNGRLAPIDIRSPLLGEKRVSVARSYDEKSYRPKLSAIEGMPLFGF
jgi:6-phosphofructokinase 1